MIIHKIEQTHFSQSEALIVDYILKNNDKIQDMSTTEIAKETYTSPPLVVRVAKKLGYSGWLEFKQAFLEEIHYITEEQMIDASIPFVVSDNFSTIANNIAQLQIDTIKDTLSLLRHDDLNKAIQLLRHTKKIDVYGTSDTLLLAKQFQKKFNFMKQSVRVENDTDDSLIQAMTSNQDHCAIVISYSGQTKHILKIAQILKQNQTPMIVLTCLADNELSQMGNLTLRMSSREMLNTKISNFASEQSITTLLNILYSCIFSLDYQDNLNNRIHFAKKMEDRYSGYEYIDEDNEKKAQI